MNDLTRLQNLRRKTPYHLSTRSELLSCFLRLSLKRAFVKNAAGVDRVMGFNVKHLGLKTLSQLFDEIFISGIYLFSAASDQPVIIDCGSNIGMSILFFKKLYPRCCVTAFEPDNETFKILEHNVAINRLSGVTLHNAAVAATEGTITFYSDPRLSGSLLMSTNAEQFAAAKKQEVECVKLSRYVNGPVDLLKLDVEGAEQQVLDDLRETGAIREISQMFIEYHHHMDQGPDRFSRAIALLEESSFRYQIYSNYSIPFVRDQFQDILIYAYRD